MTRCRIRLLATLALLVAPLAATAQPRGHLPLVAVLSPATAEALSESGLGLEAFRPGLRDLGYVEGQTILLEYRHADWQPDRLPALAAELVRLTPDVIVTYTTPGALAAKAATTTIPIVVYAGDLLGQGIVASLARPGGNVTGLQFLGPEINGKRLELLKEAAPQTARVAVLVNPANPAWSRAPSDIEAEARVLGVQVQRVEAGEPAAFDDAFAAMVRSRADALLIPEDALFNAHRHRLLDLAVTHRLPTVCGVQPYAEAGCLMAYSHSHAEMFRRAATYVDKILKGAKPGDLPVERPTTFELVINLKTAQALGLTIPPSLLFQADKVIR
jgi:putative tryptophan/tyrosine transport system substrate-binding protein